MFLKRHLFQSWTLTGVLAGLVWIVPQVYAAAGLELYGTFHAMGVIVTQDYICFINLTFKHYGQCSNLSLMAAIVCSIRLKKKPGILNTAQQTAARECRHRVLSC